MAIYDARFETADRETVRGYQLERLKALMEKAWATNDFYRAHWQKAGVDIAAIDSLEAFAARIPMVEKPDFIADQADDPPFGRRHAHLLSLGVPYTVFITGGTTGQGVEVHLQSNADMAGIEEIYRYQFTWAGIAPGAHTFLMLPMTMMGGGRIEYIGAVAFGLSLSAVGNYDAGRKLELLERFRPTAIIANTSYFGHLAAVSGESPPLGGLTHLFSGGEGSGHAYLERIEQQWQAPVYDRYGNTQMGNDHMFSCEAGIGTDDRPGLLHNVDPLVLTEVIDPETGRHVADGEAGELVLTNLYRLDSPIVRCRVRDRAVYREARYCACGRSFAGVEVATISRTDDMKKVKNVNIWPQAVENALFAEPQVEDFEIVLSSDQRESDTATARVMPREALADGDAAGLAERLGGALRARVGIRFEVIIIAPGGLARGDLKVRRWKDERIHQTIRGPAMSAIDILCNLFTPESIAKNYLENEEEASRFAQVGRTKNLVGYEPADFIARMDELSISTALICAIITWSYRGQHAIEQTTVEEVVEVADQYPDRLFGLYGVNPMTAMAGVAGLERAVREHRFKGIHIHPHGFDLGPDHAYYFPFYAKCQELGVPAVISMGHTLDIMPIENGRPARLDRAAIYFPDLAFVLTHTGWPWIEEAIAMAWKHPNVFLGTSAYAPKYWKPEMVKFINSHGQDKVMWGTDFPLIDHAESLGQIDELGLRETSKAKLLHDNAARVFGLD